MIRDSRSKPSPAESICRTMSPSSRLTVRELVASRAWARPRATVDLPDPDSPLSMTTRPRRGRAGRHRARISASGMVRSASSSRPSSAAAAARHDGSSASSATSPAPRKSATAASRAALLASSRQASGTVRTGMPPSRWARRWASCSMTAVGTPAVELGWSGTSTLATPSSVGASLVRTGRASTRTRAHPAPRSSVPTAASRPAPLSRRRRAPRTPLTWPGPVGTSPVRVAIGVISSSRRSTEPAARAAAHCCGSSSRTVPGVAGPPGAATGVPVAVTRVPRAATGPPRTWSAGSTPARTSSTSRSTAADMTTEGVLMCPAFS